MKSLYKIKSSPKALDENIVQKNKLRLSLLTSCLVRIEWSDTGSFVDNPSQKVWFRNFSKVPFFMQNTDNGFYVETEKLIIRYNNAENLRDSVYIKLKSPCASWNVITGRVEGWRYGDKIYALPGTARTLDNTDGQVELEDGIISRNGFSVLDDSDSCIIMEDGTVVPRKETNSKDIYFFAYGHDYKKCLSDYFTLTGKTPLLPRWALGNWWSRYHKYSQQEYLALMEDFKKRGIPLSVAMIDMDWHLTQIDSSIGSGWTGYTWNKEYFPKPKDFLTELHEKYNLKVSLNIHPAEGIGRHEVQYNDMVKVLGLEEDGKTILFDFTNTKFIEAYFDTLLGYLEKDGVDFWWIDWQQGTTTSTKNLDPLWLLNHYHYLDNSKNGNRPLILSRYAGPGSHRYPVGFSGDTVISWKSLALQPYFTFCASNIGYGWWSHDIGGHMLGTYDEELQVRWAQFGVFSPIMRLHSSSSRFNHKEPWNYDENAYSIIKKYMVLRHKMLPYLYTMNVRFSKTGEPLISPMYYSYPEENEAYNVTNEYMFGSELVCAPITSPAIKELNMAKVKVWLPNGTFTDIFTGVTYSGGKVVNMYRHLSEFPLLLKPAGIFVMQSESQIEKMNELPSELELYVANDSANETSSSFVLTEDDGESVNVSDSAFCKTNFSMKTGKTSVLEISKAEGNTSLLPAERKYTVNFVNCNAPKKVTLVAGSQEKELQYSYDALKRTVSVEFTLKTDSSAKVELQCEKNSAPVIAERCAHILDKANIDFVKKDQLFEIIKSKESDGLAIMRELLLRNESAELCEALLELIEAC